MLKKKKNFFREGLVLFGSCFLKLFLRTVFKNIKNTILVLSENCFCYLNLVVSLFFIFFILEKLRCVFPIFLIFLIFIII